MSATAVVARKPYATAYLIFSLFISSIVACFSVFLIIHRVKTAACGCTRPAAIAPARVSPCSKSRYGCAKGWHPNAFSPGYARAHLRCHPLSAHRRRASGPGTPRLQRSSEGFMNVILHDAAVVGHAQKRIHLTRAEQRSDLRCADDTSGIESLVEIHPISMRTPSRSA